MYATLPSPRGAVADASGLQPPITTAGWASRTGQLPPPLPAAQPRRPASALGATLPPAASRPMSAKRAQPYDAEAVLRQQLQRAKAELGSTSAELMKAKAALSMLDPRQPGSARLAKDLGRHMSNADGGHPRPLNGAPEFVSTRSAIYNTDTVETGALQLRRLERRLELSDGRAQELQQQLVACEDELIRSRAEAARLQKEQRSLVSLAQSVGTLAWHRAHAECGRRGRSGIPPAIEANLWKTIEDRLGALGLYGDFHKEDLQTTIKIGQEDSAQRPRGRYEPERQPPPDKRRREHDDEEAVDRTHEPRSEDARTAEGEGELPGEEPAERPRSRGWAILSRAVHVLRAAKSEGVLLEHRMPAVLLQDFCERLGDEFDPSAGGVGVHEFVASRAADEEFHSRVGPLVRGPARTDSTTLDVMRMEDQMREKYNSAFEAAGGDERVEACAVAVSKLLRDLRRLRPPGRVRQDVGFGTLGLDALFTLNSLRWDKMSFEVHRIGVETGGEVIIPGLKDRIRARQKTLTKYGNDAGCLTDLLRASIVYDGIDHLYEALHKIIHTDLKLQRRDFFLREVEDRFQRSKDGYRDIAMLVEVDGCVGELQLHARPILETKKGGGHKAYRHQRAVNELIFEACVRNNEPEIAALTQRHQTCAPTVRDKSGRGALHYACQHGSVFTARLLLQFGAAPWAEDDQGVLPCELGLRAPSLDAVELVLAQMCKQAPPNPRVIRRFVEHCVLWWCDRGAFGPDAKERALQGQWHRTGEIMIRIAKLHEEFGGIRLLETWLHDAATKGHIGRARALIQVGFDVEVVPDKHSALDRAIEGGQGEMAAFLYDYGTMGVNCCVCSLKSANDHLRDAAAVENGPRTAAALAAHANPNHVTARLSGKRTALMTFAAAGDLATCQTLVAYRAQVDDLDRWHCSARHYAMAMKHPEICGYFEQVKHNWTEMPLRPRGQDMLAHVRDLVEESVRVGCCGGLARAASQAPDEFEEILKHKFPPYDYTLLHLAADAVPEHDLTGQGCRALLLALADPTAECKQSFTPLHQLAYQGNATLYRIMASAAETGPLIARRKTGEAGPPQLPHELLQRGVERKERFERLQREHAEQAHGRGGESQMLLEAAFLGFRHAVLGTRLNQWREDHAVSFMDVLRQSGPLDLLWLGGDGQSSGSEQESPGSPSPTASTSRLSTGTAIPTVTRQKTSPRKLSRHKTSPRETSSSPLQGSRARTPP